MSGDPTVEQLLRRIRKTDLAALEHHAYPFDKVIELVNPTRSMSYNPGIQVLLAFQVGELVPPRLPGVVAEAQQLDVGIAKFALTFELTECSTESSEPDGITGHLEFAADLFDQNMAECIVQELRSLLTFLVREPARQLDELDW
ncbi:condensation domain-containing protein [Amycolatopsis ultiminotia]|uniref:condensation domain-containing protein n=1 Tax=Amycolatopsis ultiminotia TaxID=543629 RepID=UPI0031EE00D2